MHSCCDLLIALSVNCSRVRPSQFRMSYLSELLVVGIDLAGLRLFLAISSIWSQVSGWRDCVVGRYGLRSMAKSHSRARRDIPNWTKSQILRFGGFDAVKRGGELAETFSA